MIPNTDEKGVCFTFMIFDGKLDIHVAREIIWKCALVFEIAGTTDYFDNRPETKWFAPIKMTNNV